MPESRLPLIDEEAVEVGLSGPQRLERGEERRDGRKVSRKNATDGGVKYRVQGNNKRDQSWPRITMDNLALANCKGEAGMAVAGNVVRLMSLSLHTPPATAAKKANHSRHPTVPTTQLKRHFDMYVLSESTIFANSTPN